jgi:hypothetical protein
MKRPIKFKAQEQKQTQADLQHGQEQSATREFATAEEMLRHDAIHTPVPPAIAYRLQNSIAQVPRPRRSWWQRWFGS